MSNAVHRVQKCIVLRCYFRWGRQFFYIGYWSRRERACGVTGEVCWRNLATHVNAIQRGYLIGTDLSHAVAFPFYPLLPLSDQKASLF